MCKLSNVNTKQGNGWLVYQADTTHEKLLSMLHTPRPCSLSKLFLTVVCLWYGRLFKVVLGTTGCVTGDKIDVMT